MWRQELELALVLGGSTIAPGLQRRKERHIQLVRKAVHHTAGDTDQGPSRALLLEPSPVFTYAMVDEARASGTCRPWVLVPAALSLFVTLGSLLVHACVLICEVGIWDLSP